MLSLKRSPRATRSPVLRAFLAAAWLLSGSPAAGEAPLLSPRTHVVVLVGIPGDAETESTYTRQIARLLELLAGASPRPGGVTILADTPELVRAPRALGARVVEASRERLREVTSALSAEELVVFVWGHGGLRGKDPVLHVRGPRIEPEDLAALGAKAERSAWFLLFRQSAAFAKRLRAPSRTLVTSEGDTAFASDPIGTELLLDLLRDHPGAGAETLARALGPATVSWYDRNRLARTEEPTLWQGTSEPIRLADVSAGASARAPGPEARVTATGAWKRSRPQRPSSTRALRPSCCGARSSTRSAPSQPSRA